MPFQQDDSHWPIAITAAIGTSQDEDVDAYIAFNEAILARRAPHVMIMDSTRGEKMQIKHRRVISDWIFQHTRELREYRAGFAFVSPSPLLRVMLTATYWLSPPPYPYEMFATMDEALAWARSQLAGHRSGATASA